MLQTPMPNRWRPLAISLAVHTGVFFALLSAPPIQLPVREKSAYLMAIAGKEPRLVWYRLDKELPRVSPVAPKPDPRPLKAAATAKQQIVAAAKQAPPQKQIVWTPAPDIPAQPPQDSPNLLALAVKLPKKTFVAPPDIRRPDQRQIDVPSDAPQIAADPVKMAELQPPPKINRRFVPPPTTVPRKLSEVEIPADAPAVAARTSRQYLAPAALPAMAPRVDTPDVTDAPPAIAIVGLNPSDLPAPLPTAPSPAQFSAGPQLRTVGADAIGDKSALTVPDLSVGGKTDLKRQLLAQAFAAPTSAANTRESMRLARTATAPVPENPLPTAPSAAMKVSGVPDPRFNGRDIYMMAIQMPNLTSYSGSWLMWYADRTARSVGLSAVAPPIAHRKVDPKYIAAAAAERVEGKIQLACVIGKDGAVSNVEIVRGLDNRLNASAVEALGKWLFTPAVRDGEPVDVDVLVEIPFRLAPAKPTAW
jgi:TonB family protein